MIDQNIIQWNRLKDRLAYWIICICGALVICCVVGILLLIFSVAFPLFKPAKAYPKAQFDLKNFQIISSSLIACGLEEGLNLAYVIDHHGVCTFFDPVQKIKKGTLQLVLPESGASIQKIYQIQPHTWSVLWSNHIVTIDKVHFEAVYTKNIKSLKYDLKRLKVIHPKEAIANLSNAKAIVNSEGSLIQVGLRQDGNFEIYKEMVGADIFGNQTQDISQFVIEKVSKGNITDFVLDQSGQLLYAGTDKGELLQWNIEGSKANLIEHILAFEDGAAITNLTLVFGDISIAVSNTKGALATWSPVTAVDLSNNKSLKKIHALTSHHAGIQIVLPSYKDKSLVSVDKNGDIYFDHMTNERHLLQLTSKAPVQCINVTTRMHGLIMITENNSCEIWQLKIPHPEFSLKVLFQKVWYEDYNEPVYVWQSSSASDDFETKLSLIPLIFGSLKGTFYALFFAVPLALMGAIYTSQFASKRAKKLIKPTVEVMAAIPSVVIGFLAALWLAPMVERNFISYIVSILLIPICLIVLLFIGDRFDVFSKGYFRSGSEFLWNVPILIGVLILAYTLSQGVEWMVCGGNFKTWLYNNFNIRYDQRNSFIIALALGFAVIPIIFTMTEDALSSVPRSLSAASMALGASRWQTVWRVMVPSASPGIFAGVIIGLGRAIGETMIVLMATGNTPIMDWSVFNGMRTLSANIAVEIPEAPFGGTLYRVLFFSAIVLFGMTFVINTIAEVVRQNLRKKYSRFQ